MLKRNERIVHKNGQTYIEVLTDKSWPENRQLSSWPHKPTDEEKFRHNLASLVRKIKLREKHELQMHKLSIRLTRRVLAEEKEIVSAASKGIFGAGVYFLIEGAKIVYVGQSVCLLSRIGDHAKTKKFDSFSIIPCNEDELDILESLYIHMLRPPLNNINSAPLSPVEMIRAVREDMFKKRKLGVKTASHHSNAFKDWNDDKPNFRARGKASDVPHP